MARLWAAHVGPRLGHARGQRLRLPGSTILAPGAAREMRESARGCPGVGRVSAGCPPGVHRVSAGCMQGVAAVRPHGHLVAPAAQWSSQKTQRGRGKTQWGAQENSVERQETATGSGGNSAGRPGKLSGAARKRSGVGGKLSGAARKTQRCQVQGNAGRERRHCNSVGSNPTEFRCHRLRTVMP